MADKKPKLTVKEINFIKGLVAGKSKPIAALDATGATTYESAAVQANRMLKKDNVQEALAEAFEKHGITLDVAIAPIGKALTAKKVEMRTGKITTEDGKVVEQTFAEEVEDVELQLKGSDRALKLMGIGVQPVVEGGLHFHSHTEEIRKSYFEEDTKDD